MENAVTPTQTDIKYAEEVIGSVNSLPDLQSTELLAYFTLNIPAETADIATKEWYLANYTYLLARRQQHLYPDFPTTFFVYSHVKVSRSQSASDNFVYVHSSNTSTQWEVPGNFKSNVIAVLPRTKQAGGSEIPLYNDTLLQTADYAVTIPISTMKTLELRLTDADGELINFEDDYLLRLVVFPQLARQQIPR
ncbi:hypothetical protein KDA23_05525 [Candidatus Saccharibacteria bacterium]|nr:hypothetical protein [Candidatus Saccharibacteria bacterium]